MQRLIKYSICLIFIFSILGSSIISASSSVNSLKDKKDELNETIRDTKKQVTNLESTIKSLNANVQNIEKKIYAASSTLDEYESQLIEKRMEIEQTKRELEKAEEEKEKYIEIAKSRIKVMYEYGNKGYLEVVLDSKNIFDFFYRVEYVNKVLEYDQDVFGALEELMNSIIEKEEKLKVEEAKIGHLVAEATLEKGKLDELVITKALEIETVKANKDELEKNLKLLEQEEARINAEIRKLTSSSDITYGGGKFAWPVPGYFRISSPFGYRNSPIFGRQEFHGGIDIPAPHGTNVIAAEAGKVIISQYSSSYGNYLVIDHGSGYSSLYAHNSSLQVKVGDYVSKGDVVAKVGSTGWSTGNHVHFEVRVNNNRVNPMEYVSTN